MEIKNNTVVQFTKTHKGFCNYGDVGIIQCFISMPTIPRGAIVYIPEWDHFVECSINQLIIIAK